MNKYIKIARPDHWIKNIFIFPGVLFAYLLTNSSFNIIQIKNLIIGFIAVCFIASANYTINEYLDKDFDKYHPIKKNRQLVSENVEFKYIVLEYIVLFVFGVIFSSFINKYFLSINMFLLFMGIIYNVKPFRTKDIVYLDVLSESINNALRLLLGWFIITDKYLPPCTIVFGYWFGGAFLMAIKRYAEYNMINDKKIAGLYRKSFQYYTSTSLLLSAFFYALCSFFLCGIFIIKYKIEFLLIMPFIAGLFCEYFRLSFLPDSVVQKPEKLYKSKTLMIYIFMISIIFIILIFINIPILQVFTSTSVITI